MPSIHFKNQFTHFTRFIPANAIHTSVGSWFRLGVWSGMLMLFVLNIVIRLNKPLHAYVVTALFARTGQPLSAAPNVLGEMTNEPSQPNSKQKENELLTAQYVFWESIVKDYPQYRDGYLELSRLGYMLNKPEVVSVNLQKASLLDPNGKTLGIYEQLAH